jgi:site-specific DNA-cytosine methylase
LIEHTNPGVLKVETGTGYTTVQLFAGGGGLALGMENAGFSHVLLNDMDPSAVATLRRNRLGWFVDDRDMRRVSFRGLRYEADVLAGSFPRLVCRPSRGADQFDHPRVLLFFELARVVAELLPRVVVVENVKGLLRHDGGHTLWSVVGALQRLGYRVAHRVLRAQYLDVPVRRERLVLIALHCDVGSRLLFPPRRGPGHPADPPLTVPERARVLTFPDDWVFCGSEGEQLRQLDGAVPVNVGYHLGVAAAAMLDGGDQGDLNVASEVPPVWPLRG